MKYYDEKLTTAKDPAERATITQERDAKLATFRTGMDTTALLYKAYTRAFAESAVRTCLMGVLEPPLAQLGAIAAEALNKKAKVEEPKKVEKK
jgi:hypothetical protein